VESVQRHEGVEIAAGRGPEVAGYLPREGRMVTMKRYSFEFGAEFKGTKIQIWPVPAAQIWEMLSVRERESLKKNAPAFGKACASC
jgi:hypothetical protein